MKNAYQWILAGALAILLITAFSVQPQLSLDEQNAIVDAVVQTMNPENMKATIAAEVMGEIIDRFTASGYVGLSAALMAGAEEGTAQTAEPVQPTATATPTPEELTSADTAAVPGVSPTPRMIETDIADYYNGAILQEDGTYRGLHAKFVHSYAYAVGSDEDGHVREFSNAFTPNKWFNVDVVFENDGTLVWPPRIEMRHTGNVGEYTGTESVSIDRTYDPILPGQRAAFTISAYGSENLGWTTFYFQLFDADSGSVIEGGQGSFSYNAY